MHKAQISRSAYFGIDGKFAYSRAWNECDKLLEKAKDQGLINEYACKSYNNLDIVWFTGIPGKELRELKSEIESRFEPGFKYRRTQ